MPDYIPWEVAKEVAEQQKCQQVIIVAWDGDTVHVVTYGQSLTDSHQAAEGGNAVKRALGWPESLCHDEPAWLKDMIKALRVAQRWICNTIPTVELDGPKPLPLIAEVLAEVEQRKVKSSGKDGAK